MTSNAEHQARWRERRNALAREALALRNAPLDAFITYRLKHETNPKERRTLLAWLDAWRDRPNIKRDEQRL